MKGKEQTPVVKTEKIHIKEMVDHFLSGKTSLFKESFDATLHLKTQKLYRSERTRMAGIMFTESYVTQPDLMDKDTVPTEVLYNNLLVLDADLYEREKRHMPEWMQEADSDGVDIEPINERDALDLTARYHSVEFTAN